MNQNHSKLKAQIYLQHNSYAQKNFSYPKEAFVHGITIKIHEFHESDIHKLRLQPEYHHQLSKIFVIDQLDLHQFHGKSYVALQKI